MDYVKSESYGTSFSSPTSDAISKVTFYTISIDYKTHYFAIVCFKEKYSYDIERHKIHPLYLDLCNKFLERKIVGWNGAFTKYNSHLIGNIELWFQEFEYLLNF